MNIHAFFPLENYTKESLEGYAKEYILTLLCPLLYDNVDVVVRSTLVKNEFGSFHVSNYDYVCRLIEKELSFVYLNSNVAKKVTLETRPNSAYQFKKTISEGDYHELSLDLDEGEKLDDRDFVEETYYSIVDAKDISKFIKESAVMQLGEDKIDPMDDGKFHAADVYVVSPDLIPPIGFIELIERKKASRNMTLHLVVDESIADDFIKENT